MVLDQCLFLAATVNAVHTEEAVEHGTRFSMLVHGMARPKQVECGAIARRLNW